MSKKSHYTVISQSEFWGDTEIGCYDTPAEASNAVAKLKKLGGYATYNIIDNFAEEIYGSGEFNIDASDRSILQRKNSTLQDENEELKRQLDNEKVNTNGVFGRKRVMKLLTEKKEEISSLKKENLDLQNKNEILKRQLHEKDVENNNLREYMIKSEVTSAERCERNFKWEKLNSEKDKKIDALNAAVNILKQRLHIANSRLNAKKEKRNPVDELELINKELLKKTNTYHKIVMKRGTLAGHRYEWLDHPGGWVLKSPKRSHKKKEAKIKKKKNVTEPDCFRKYFKRYGFDRDVDNCNADCSFSAECVNNPTIL